jgi:hypothetical protein
MAPRVAQGEGPEFKPLYKTKEKSELSEEELCVWTRLFP